MFWCWHGQYLADHSLNVHLVRSTTHTGFCLFVRTASAIYYLGRTNLSLGTSLSKSGTIYSQFWPSFYSQVSPEFGRQLMLTICESDHLAPLPFLPEKSYCWEGNIILCLNKSTPDSLRNITNWAEELHSYVCRALIQSQVLCEVFQNECHSFTKEIAFSSIFLFHRIPVFSRVESVHTV